MMRARFMAALMFAGLAGCSAFPKPQPDITSDVPPMPALTRTTGTSGGVFSAATGSLAADSRAYRSGDTLTVTLDEATQASKKAGTSFGKKNSIDVNPGMLLGATLNAETSISGNRTFDGSGTSSQQNTLKGEMTVIVQDVLPGGLLLVRGEKVLGLNQGEEVMRLAGYVRPADIDTNNRVSSRRLANARIQYVGKGALSDANQAGWLTRMINSPWMPF